MNWGIALKIAAVAIGVTALCILIWFAFPLVAVADVRPFESGLVRGILIACVVLAAAALVGIGLYRRRKAAAALAQALTTEAEAEGDAIPLRDTMKDALATLKRAGGSSGKDHLYDLPWYVIIGPPGSGKTTALVNSGLKFPLARGATPQAVAGVGGTRYCDWWFAEDAVLIDTAGRYTTQDSDPKGDRKSWLSFLGLLKTNRPRQPINGVIVAISLEDLLTLDEAGIAGHADAIRKRLMELHDELKIDFPVYAMFTKADLVAGFNEFFAGYNEMERRMVWGHTFQTADKTRNMVGEIPAEFDALIERLNEQLPDRLQDEPNPSARAVLFGFPSQVAALKQPLTDFLKRVFEPTRYQTNATLRGLYFTSGTQKGTPIDQLIGRLARNFGADDVPAQAYSGLGKSYFLTDLLQKVLIGEAGWVSTNRGAIRRTMLMRAGAFGVLALLSAVLVAVWWMSFARNSDLVASTGNALIDYRTAAAPVLQETTISDRNFAKVLPHLHKLRNMPTGYGVRDEPTPLPATFGLSQRERLQSAAETSYQVALERMFRSRIIYRLEEQLEANISNPGFTYEALKVYLMVGGQAKLDRDLVIAWMRRDWAENLFPGAANAKGREALEEHLVAMLDLDPGREPVVSLNQSLIQDCQRTLARMSVAERGYELLRSQARGQSQKDWVAAWRGGPDVKLVFEGVNGQELESVRVPFFFTYLGFHTAFIDRLGDIGGQINNERWVLGTAGEQSAVVAQYQTLFQDLLRLYTRDFVATWQQTLRRIKLRSLTADKPKYVALAAAAAPTSPFKQILESIRDETQLTKERPKQPEAGKNAAAVAGGVAAQAVSRANPALGAALGGLAGQPLGVDRASAGGEVPGANIEGQFKQFHVLTEGDLGRRPVDALLQTLSEIAQSLAVAATNPQQAAAANNALVGQIANLRATSSRYPAPFDGMIVAAVNDFEGDATGATVATLRQQLADQVTRVCEQVITNRYPFVKGSQREVPLADMARLFAPNGAIDKFFTQSLAPFVDQSKGDWSWRLDSRVARSLSAATLREFQRAADIREAFFPTGGNMPAFTMVVTPVTLPGDASTGKLEINGFAVQSQQGVNAPAPIQWPGGGVGRTAVTLGLGGGGGGFFSSGTPATQQQIFERQGVWSLFRFLDASSVLKQGDSVLVSLAAGGREVSYQFNVGSLKNPLVLPALREFRCPTGL